MNKIKHPGLTHKADYYMHRKARYKYALKNYKEQ